MKFSFKKKSLLISGGTSQLGVELAKQALALGFELTLGYCRDSSREKVIMQLGEDSKKIHWLLLDYSDRESVLKINSQNFGYFCDLAEPNFESLVASASSSELTQYFQNSITHRAILLKQLVRGMLRNKEGRLIFLSSTATCLLNPGQGFYAASKAAGEQLYRAVGIEMAKKGITSAILQAGYINTGRGAAFIANSDYNYLSDHSDREKSLCERIPSGKVLTAEQVAETLLFLLSDSALAINGSSFRMDGGLCCSK